MAVKNVAAVVVVDLVAVALVAVLVDSGNLQFVRTCET